LDVSAHRPEHLDLCAGYALGSLDAGDRDVLEAHLAEGCGECEAELQRLAGAARRVAAAAPPLVPSPALRARVMAAAAAEPRRVKTVEPRSTPAATPRPVTVVEPIRRPRRAYAAWAMGTVAAAFAVATVLTWNTAERLRNEIAATRAQLDRAQRDLEEARRWAAVLDSPNARSVSLTPTPQGMGIMRARATFDPRSHRAVIAFENVVTPAGSDFQLWALRGAGVASLGLVHADPAGRAIVRLENVGDPATLAGFAVSLERAGGSTKPDAPEGPVVMAGKFGG
jgi:anti-sigma-K factor RskA